MGTSRRLPGGIISAADPGGGAPPELDPTARDRLAACLQSVRDRMAAAARRAGRPPQDVALLAVTKTFGTATVAAAARLGQRAFGENYAQEAVAKMAQLHQYPDVPPLQWHFIGPLQSNKTRLVAENFDWVQSLERLSIAQRLDAQRPAGRPPLQVLIEVNVSGEASKSGVAPEALLELALPVAGLPRLCLRGLMAIPAPGLGTEGQAAAFARLRALHATLRAALPAPAAARVDTLSMGMSADFETAIAGGSTMVRVGSAIFGERQ